MSSFSRFTLIAGTALTLSSGVALAGNICQPGYGANSNGGCYRLVTTPAEYGTVSHQVVVAPERRVARHIPAEYGLVEEKVLVRPVRTYARHTPAVVQTVAEHVQVAPASRRWQVSRDSHGQVTGCWVDVPAQYGVQHRQVVVQPASVSHETIPAEYGIRTRKVMTRPANVEHDYIPAVVETRHSQVLVRPATRGWQPVGGY
jgi:hypothetical protein